MRRIILLLVLTGGVVVATVGVTEPRFRDAAAVNATAAGLWRVRSSRVPDIRLNRAPAIAGRGVRAAQLRRAFAASTSIDSLYQELTNRVAFNQDNFYVFLTQDSGFNHGFPSGFFGDTSAITIDAGCVDDPSDTTTGCFPSTDTSALDTTRGTVLRVTFAPLPAGQFAGLNIEEPQNYGVLMNGVGYDLTGATAVGFEVRSPDVAMVQFGVGGCVTQQPLTIGPNWTKMVIPVSSLVNNSNFTCPPDLTNVHILFSVSTNDPNGGTVLLSGIYFTPVPSRTNQGSETLSLPFSTQTYAVVPQQSNFPPDQVNRNVAAIYESALTLLALLHRGQAGDLANAKEIADAFHYALYHDNHGDYIPTSPTATAGCYAGAAASQCALHNAFEDGDIALLNNQVSPATGQAGAVRLAGFTCGAASPTGFCLVLDGATGGNNAFALIAALTAYQQFEDANYLNDAKTIANWIVANLKDTTGTGYGGYYVGYPDMGVPPPKPLIKGKSVENNADIFAALSMLAAVDTANAVAWTADANVAGDFVTSMFDPIRGRFYAGTVTLTDAGHPGLGVCPDLSLTKGNDVVNTCDFLDSDSFTTLAMAGSEGYKSRIDWAEPGNYMLKTFPQTITAGGMTYFGFDLVPTPTSGRNGIAWEFTGQVVETCEYLDALLGVNTFQSCVQTYSGQILQALSSAPFGDGLGLVASTLDGESAPPNNLPPVDECLITPFQCIPERVGLAATNWAIFSQAAFNPLAPSSQAASVSVSPGSLSFVSQLVNTKSAPQAVTVTNSGDESLTFASITVRGEFSLDSSGSCSTSVSVEPGMSCTVAVVFQPTAGGSATGSVTLVDNAPTGPQTIDLTGTGEDFLFSTATGASTSATVTPGQSASYSLSLTPEGGLSGLVTFACSGSPAEATCSASPVTLNGTGAATVTVTVTTTASSTLFPKGPSGEKARRLHWPPPTFACLAVVLATTTLWLVCRKHPGARTRPLYQFVLTPALVFFVLVITNCGGGSGSSGTTNGGTLAGTYNLTVTATLGSGPSTLSHNVMLTLVVQ